MIPFTTNLINSYSQTIHSHDSPLQINFRNAAHSFRHPNASALQIQHGRSNASLEMPLFQNFDYDNVTFQISNDTFEFEYPEIPYYIKATSIAFCIIIMCLGVIGNVMVPIVILKTKDMRNSTNIFLVNLSIADLMVLLVCTPTVLVEVTSKPETWVLGKELCLAVPFVELTVAHASVLTILAISFERYYAICEPLRAGYVCTKTRATLICALAWFFAALFTSPILGVASYEFEEYIDGTQVPVCLTQADTFWSALFFILTIAFFFIIPLAVLLILYSVIAKNLMESPVIISQSNKNQPSGSALRYRRQVILMLGTVVLSFFICLLPFKALTLWIIVFPPETIMSLGLEGYYILLYFCRIMLYLNSAINPILYNLMSSKFRGGFVKLLRINKIINFRKNLRESMQRRDTFNTTTSTGFSSSRNTSDSFWRRYSNRTSSQKNVVKSESIKAKEQSDKSVQPSKIVEIVNVQNTRRNSMKMVTEIVENKGSDVIDTITNNKANVSDESETIDENNKQIQILNLDVKTNSVYSITLDVSERNDNNKNRFVVVPIQHKTAQSFVYDHQGKESFV